MLKARTPRTSEAIDPNWARLGKIPSPVIGGADSTCGSLGRKSSRGLSTARVPLGIKPVLFVNSPFAFTDASRIGPFVISWPRATACERAVWYPAVVRRRPTCTALRAEVVRPSSLYPKL
jgi:hypothetical protein